MCAELLNRDEENLALEPMNGCGLLGALKCVAGVEGILPMIHGPVSCSSGHRLAMLYSGVEPLLPTTCVEQTQVIRGSADRLADAMDKAFAKYHPEVLVVLLSCATAMTGEDYGAVVAAYQAKTGKHAIVLDGSALAGDEVDICPQVYEALSRALGIAQGTDGRLALEGFARTDYAFEANRSALKALIEENLSVEWTDGLFAGSDVFEENGRYRTARKVFGSLLWRREGLHSAAPIGVRGSERFLKYLSQELSIPMLPQARQRAAEYAQKLSPLAQALKPLRLPVAIEGAGWYAYALADYLKNDLNCRVLLSVDRSSDQIDWRGVCDAFYEDTGRFELVELMREFGAKLVFGSSNVQLDEAWSYIPFYQPVWRVVEPMALLGYEAAIDLARRLLQEAKK